MNNREVIKLSTSTLKTVHFQLMSLTISGMEQLIGPIFVLDFFKCRILVGMLDLYSEKMDLILTHYWKLYISLLTVDFVHNIFILIIQFLI